ncbi:hypothetical protein IAQ61_001009 [Plenodomus lingam]|uniref:uncharacterized protein n=1 Tax=Leptosphaeria maculans TaxID=5022 RepID=UPI00331DA608|nr:hypothetical protein IAQ61_001009 [Plenodomus lingam]
MAFPNTILYNDHPTVRLRHDRASLEPDAPGSKRLAFPNASAVLQLPFFTVSFGDDSMKYTTTPKLLKTVAAVATPTGEPTLTGSGQLPAFTGAGSRISLGVVAALPVAMGFAAYFV